MWKNVLCVVSYTRSLQLLLGVVRLPLRVVTNCFLALAMMNILADFSKLNAKSLKEQQTFMSKLTVTLIIK